MNELYSHEKILVMSPVYQGFGGAEFMVMNLAAHYKELGHDVKVVLEDSEYLKTLKLKCEAERVPVVLVKIGDADLKGFKRLRALWQQTFIAVKTLRSERPDAVHIVLPSLPQGLHLLLACKLTKTPANVNFVLVGASDRGLVSSKKAKIYRWIKRPCQIWSALSKNNALIIEDAFGLEGGCVRIVHNGYMPKNDSNSKDRNTVRSELDIADDKFVIITTARLAEQKGYKWLIEAMPKLVEKFSDILFLWVGDGDDRETIEQLVSTKNMQNYVKMTGFRSDVMDLLKASDLFVFPTEFEGGAPFSLHEAIYAGCPVVTSNASGIPEIMQHEKHGLIFETQNSDDLYEKVKMALDDMDAMREYAKVARSEVSEKFSSKNMYKQYDELMLDVLNLKSKHE